MYYIGLDVHKQKISYCVKDGSGKIYAEGWIPATRFDLDRWMKRLPQPWSAALEATMFSGWIYDHLRPHAAALKVAHPLMLRAIAAAKKKNDCIDANKIWKSAYLTSAPRVPNHATDSIQQGTRPVANKPRNRKEKF